MRIRINNSVFFYYLLCLFHFYKNTKIQNTLTNIILHKKFMKLKEAKKYVYKITNFLKRILRLLQDPHNIQNGNFPDISQWQKAIK